jgi:hypothetical protein
VTAWGEEELRRAALEALGPADPRARDVLARAEVTVAPAVARWDSSAGPVEAHRVTLGVDAGTLGAVRAAPSVVDMLCKAVAAALAARPGETLHDLRLCWTPSGRARAAGYRDAPPPAPQTPLGEALAAYLVAGGQDALAAAVTAADVDGDSPGEVAIRSEPSGRTVLGGPGAVDTVTRAVRDLLADETLRVRLR